MQYQSLAVLNPCSAWSDFIQIALGARESRKGTIRLRRWRDHSSSTGADGVGQSSGPSNDPDGGAFSVTPDHRRLIAHGPEAWRYLRWEVRDEANRLVELLPAGF